jgi:F-type H+-transporting ATPase subunit delta
MHDVKIAKRYAAALFETALESKDDKLVAAVEDDFGGIVSLLMNNERFRTLILSPEVSRDEKLGLVDRLFSDRITAVSLEALRLMIEKGREQEIEWVQREFVRLRRIHENTLFVVVTTAEALDEDQRVRLMTKLAQITQMKLEAEYRIDPHLIGGIRVAYDNYVLDGSLRGELRRLRERLLHDVLIQS